MRSLVKVNSVEPIEKFYGRVISISLPAAEYTFQVVAVEQPCGDKVNVGRAIFVDKSVSKSIVVVPS